MSFSGKAVKNGVELNGSTELVPLSIESTPLPPSTAIERLEGESLQSIIENYIRYYASGAGHTARAKRYDLQYFLEFLAQGAPPEVVRVNEWTLQTTKDFVDARLALGESPTTVSRRLATIKHFGRTLAERISGYINPAREVKSPVIPQTRPHGLSSDAIELLKRAASDQVARQKGEFGAIRNRFLLELLLATGLRADEVRLLVMAQLSDDYCWLKNVKTKGRKYRNVYLDSQIRDLFQEYLEHRSRALFERFPLLNDLPAAEGGRIPVLVSFYRAQYGKWSSFGLSPKTIWRSIASIGKHAQSLVDTPNGSNSHLHPHRLRHTFAHGLLESSKDVRLVAQALGHSDVRVTMRYTERSEEEIARAIEQKVARN